MRKWIAATAVVVLLGAAYAAWPVLGFVQLAQAVHSRNAGDALDRIDVVAVRRSILTQVLDESTRGGRIDRDYGQLGRSIAVGFMQSAAERRFANLMDENAVRALIADGRLPSSLAAELQRSVALPEAEAFSVSGLPENPFGMLRRWRIRSPVTVDMAIGEDARARNWTTFRLRRSGFAWKLVAVELPDALVDRLKPVVQQKLAEAGL